MIIVDVEFIGTARNRGSEFERNIRKAHAMRDARAIAERLEPRVRNRAIHLPADPETGEASPSGWNADPRALPLPFWRIVLASSAERAEGAAS